MKNNNTQSPRLLLVDDETEILSSLRRFIRHFNWECEFAESGEEALTLLQQQEFDVVISDMRMPHMSGSTLLQRCLEHDPDMVRILLTGYSDIEAVMEAVNDAKIYNFITKPWDDNLLSELLEGAVRYRDIIRHNRHLQKLTKEQNSLLTDLNESLEQKVSQRTRELSRALKTNETQNALLEDNFSNIVALLANLIEHQEGKCSHHSRSVTDLSVAVANSMQLKAKEVDELRIAAMLHDIGMLGLSDAIHNKPFNSLTKKELIEYQKHPVVAEATLAGVGNMDSIAQIVRMHHEKIDGSGFPDGLSGSQIPLNAKILCAVSDYHDLIHGNFDNHVRNWRDALEYLQNHAAHQYDQSVIKVLVEVLAKNTDQTTGSMTIECSELTPNMRLATDLISDSGLLLLSKGSSPSTAVIKRLNQYQHEANTKLQVVIDVVQEITLDKLPDITESLI